MIILHNPHCKASRQFVEQHSADAEQVIDWFGSEAVKKKFLKSGGVAPVEFPTIASTHAAEVCVVPKTDNPLNELEKAENQFFNENMAEYGSLGYGTSWAQLVVSEIIPIEKARESVVVAIKHEAQNRIFKVWDVTTVEDSIIRQMNQQRADNAAGTTDERFAATDAIRTASNALEETLADMDHSALSVLNVFDWKGWPGSEEEE
ncbi:hypothetical protein [Maridesulfovibrio sp.]|uniref:hypothetical protein n=1 Tax=Maridesulfovibrio sp. TaxID=2795000 RepID=UPI002A188651|nr:hypothetical protein [Maridesulfovibrio sp.]